MPHDNISPHVRFTEELRVQYGPGREIGAFLLEGDRQLFEMGVRLYVSHDLGRLVEINRRHSDSWAPLMPAFDPARSNVRSDDAFLFELRDGTGEIIATQASRRIDLTGTTLKSELEQLRLFYRDPARQAGAGERIEVTSTKAADLTGPIALTGGLWYRPDWRGKGLSRILPRMTRTFAYTRWGMDCAVSFVEQSAIDHGLVHLYGLPDTDPWIKIRDSYRPAVDLLLTWRHGADIAGDVRAYTAAFNKRRDRLSDVPDTQNSPEVVRHGSSNRS